MSAALNYDLGVDCPEWIKPAALWRGACALAKRATQAILTFVDQAQRAYRERVERRVMALRRFFFTQPYAKDSPFTDDGKRVLRHWTAQANYFNSSYGSEMDAVMKGRRQMLDLILADLAVNPEDFFRILAQDEESEFA